MRLQSDIIGKEVLNAKGNILGNVKDIEIDTTNKKITFLILSKTKKTGFSLTSNDSGAEEKIPVEELGSIGDKIILKETLDNMIYNTY